MDEKTVKELAKMVGIPVSRFLEQLKEAGLSQRNENETLSENDKIHLLTFLRSRHKPNNSDSIHSKKKAFVKKDLKGISKKDKIIKNKKVFLSYAWEDDKHNKWVKQLASRLRTDGVEAILDIWELHPGDQIIEFMEKSIKDSDYVLLVCTPKYKIKADTRKGGVGYEGAIISNELYSKSNHRKFIPILRSESWAKSAPVYATSKLYINLCEADGEVEEENYRDLLITILGRREIPPKVGDIQ